jgi:hypothetical protein
VKFTLRKSGFRMTTLTTKHHIDSRAAWPRSCSASPTRRMGRTPDPPALPGTGRQGACRSRAGLRVEGQGARGAAHAVRPRSRTLIQSMSKDDK